MNNTDKLELQVAEDVDGSATVILDEELKEGGVVDAEDRDHDDDDAKHAADDEAEAQVAGRTEEEREEIRAARREERKLKKQIHKGKVRESNHLIDSLRRQNSDLAERLSLLEKKSVGADMARLDKSIEDANLRMQYAKSKIAEATSVMDGKALAEAQEMWYDARRQAESLDAVKKRAITDAPRQPVPNGNDVRMQRKAAVWMERNPWYDPDGKDTDSAVAVKIDESLAAEGWDPTTDEYWAELDERLTKYMPHRYNRGTENRSSGKSPRSVVTGSGREASSASSRPGEYKISPDRVKAMKDAGKWDDPIERQKMIRKYVEYDRSQGR
jgi:hypothetical protein